MRAVFLTAVLTHYRVPFHERARELMGRAGIRYELIFGQPKRDEAAKADTTSLPWATRIENRYFPLGRLTWQPALRHIRGADLVILGQENRLLLNYILQLTPRRLRPAIALFGHGRNFQARNRNSLAELWKRHWMSRCEWWFGYTEETRRHLGAHGFPSDRITVLNNVIDTASLREQLRCVTPERMALRRQELGLRGANVGIFIGSLYKDKRIDFLVEAADRIRLEVPDFELVIVGAGPVETDLCALAADRPWLKLAGPRLGAEKAEILRLAKLFLIPGAVGLAVLDAAAAGLPLVTTDYPFHGPEFCYLSNGVTGLSVAEWRSVQAYADAVAHLLRAEDARTAMADAARRLGAAYTIDAMAESLVEGVTSCLARESGRASGGAGWPARMSELKS